MTTTVSSPHEGDRTQRQRVLKMARARLMSLGYGPLNMGELAKALGMSKKTLYQLYGTKHLLVHAVIDDLGAEVRDAAVGLLNDSSLPFNAKVQRFIEGMIERLSTLSPAALHDLQRLAPDLYERMEEMRARNIPFVFGQFIEQGQRAGLVRDDVRSAVAVQFLLRGIQGTMTPDNLRRLELSPPQVFDSIIHLFFGGLLTPAGRRQYERNRKH